jgi:uncharacterized cupin superfamily protein
MIKKILKFSALNTHSEALRPDAAKIVAGDPAQTVRNHYTNASGEFFSGEWSGEVGKWKINYTEDEFCFVTRGRNVLTDADGVTVAINAGDAFVIPAGFQGTWEVLESTHKFYAIFERKLS